MHRARLLLLLGLALALATTSVAQGKNSTPFVKDQGQTKNDKAKSKNNDGHRKHWYSPPHFGHKKNDSKSGASRTSTNSSHKTVAANSMNKTATHTSSSSKAAGSTKPGQKTVAKTGQGTNHKKSVRHNCSPEEAKKGGCQASKARS